MLMFLHRKIISPLALGPVYTFGAPTIFCETAPIDSKVESKFRYISVDRNREIPSPGSMFPYWSRNYTKSQDIKAQPSLGRDLLLMKVLLTEV